MFKLVMNDLKFT